MSPLVPPPRPPVPPAPRPTNPDQPLAAGTMILGESQLSILLRRPDILHAFPFLAAYKPMMVKGGGCGSCGGRRHPEYQQWAVNMSAMRAALLNMTEEQKKKLKSLLGVKQVVLYISGPHGPEKKYI